MTVVHKTVQVYIKHFLLTVPGITASQLYVNDRNQSSRCYTNGKYDGLWINEIRLIEYLDCAPQELK